jgi:hypothetical protein
LSIWGPNIFLSTLFSTTLSLCSSLTSTLLLNNTQNLCEQDKQVYVSRSDKGRV